MCRIRANEAAQPYVDRSRRKIDQMLYRAGLQYMQQANHVRLKVIQRPLNRIRNGGVACQSEAAIKISTDLFENLPNLLLIGKITGHRSHMMQMMCLQER